MNQDTAVKLDDVSESYQVDFILDGKIKHEELLVINKISLKTGVIELIEYDDPKELLDLVDRLLGD